MKRKGWDEAIKDGLKETQFRGEDHYTIMLKVLQDMRSKYPIFRIDKEVYEAMFPFGEDMAKKEATEENLKLVRAPYPVQIIEMSNPSQSLNIVILDTQADKENPSTQLQIYGFTLKDNQVIVPGLSIFIDTAMRGKTISQACVGFSLGNRNPQVGNTEAERQQYAAKFFQESGDFINHSVCLMMGFCLSIAAKGMLEKKAYQPKTLVVKNKLGRKSNIQENGYTKVTLSLKGKEHLEYIREKNQGGERHASRMHFRRGHFKQRATGLFWWNAHLLYKDTEHYVTHDYEVKK